MYFSNLLLCEALIQIKRENDGLHRGNSENVQIKQAGERGNTDFIFSSATVILGFTGTNSTLKSFRQKCNCKVLSKQMRGGHIPYFPSSADQQLQKAESERR